MNIKKHIADQFATSDLTRMQVASGKVIIKGKAYKITSNDPNRPLTDLDVLIEDFQLTEFKE